MKIAIVGGIGSGKSEVLKTAREMGFACLSADEINAELLLSPSYVQELSKLFPTVVQNGNIDKKALANIVFCDENAREQLNKLAHPLILDKIKYDTRSPLIVEVPLLFESGAEDMFDEIIAVVSPIGKRIDRLKSSRGMQEDDILARINSQVDDDEYLKVATHTIENDSSICDLQAKTKELFKLFL